MSPDFVPLLLRQPPSAMGHFRRLILPLALLATFPGCKTLPNTQPFVAATTNLRAAVAESGDATVVGLKRSAVAHPGLDATAAQLGKEWKVRDQAFDALVEYAQSIQAITDAGKSGEDAAKKLVGSVEQLATTVGIAAPVSSRAFTLVSDTAGFVWGEIAKARAAKSLETALVAIQPSVDRIAGALAEDLTDLSTILSNAAELEKGELQTKYQAEFEFDQTLSESRRNLLKKLQLAATDSTDELLTPSESDPPATDAAKTSPPHAQQALMTQLELIDALLAKQKDWRTTYEAQLAQIHQSTDTGLEILAGAKRGLREWADAHRNLLIAIQAKHPPTVAELTAAAERIKGLVHRYRELTHSAPASPASQ